MCLPQEPRQPLLRNGRQSTLSPVKNSADKRHPQGQRSLARRPPPGRAQALLWSHTPPTFRRASSRQISHSPPQPSHSSHPDCSALARSCRPYGSRRECSDPRSLTWIGSCAFPAAARSFGCHPHSSKQCPSLDSEQAISPPAPLPLLSPVS